MAKHRFPELPEVSEQSRHARWVALFLWVSAGVMCLAVGFVCCMGILLKG